MRIIRRIIFQLLCLLGACCYIPATAQVVLVDNGKTKSRIILSENDQINQISINGKTKCSTFTKHFVLSLALLTQNKMCILSPLNML